MPPPYNFHIINSHFKEGEFTATMRWQVLEYISPHYSLPPGGLNERLEIWRHKVMTTFPGCVLHTPESVFNFKQWVPSLPDDDDDPAASSEEEGDFFL